MAPKRGGGGLRRPAALLRMRRPAARGEDGEVEEEGPKRLVSLTIDELKTLGPVVLKNAKYYGREIQVAGRFGSLVAQGWRMTSSTQISLSQGARMTSC